MTATSRNRPVRAKAAVPPYFPRARWARRTGGQGLTTCCKCNSSAVGNPTRACCTQAAHRATTALAITGLSGRCLVHVSSARAVVGYVAEDQERPAIDVTPPRGTPPFVTRGTPAIPASICEAFLKSVFAGGTL